jgi:hypothetical protein
MQVFLCVFSLLRVLHWEGGLDSGALSGKVSGRGSGASEVEVWVRPRPDIGQNLQNFKNCAEGLAEK